MKYKSIEFQQVFRKHLENETRWTFENVENDKSTYMKYWNLTIKNFDKGMVLTNCIESALDYAVSLSEPLLDHIKSFNELSDSEKTMLNAVTACKYAIKAAYNRSMLELDKFDNI